jgi:two-component system CheB/CheR fusion protein
MLVFSEQDLIKDPPFSRLDLISCRNLLIYMGGDLQKKLIPLFHYALRPGGFLFQGSSETVGEFGDLFGVLDAGAKLYQRKEDINGAPRAALGRMLPAQTATDRGALGFRKQAGPTRLPLRELTEQALLQQVAPAAALVNDRGDILYLHGRTGPYLELAPGEAGINNVLKMARTGLKRDLATALHKAALTQAVVSCPNLRVRTNDDYSRVNLTIRPVPVDPARGAEASLFLVVLEPAPAVPKPPEQPSGAPDTDALTELRQELQAKEDYLKASNEELETSNEELKSANEEMQSVNEELQSTNEELETSKEELQSVNEELATVNAELQTKVTDLSQANNDMNNLLAGTGIGTVFVDQRLRILRFTPAASKIINLIPGDVGRPVGHIVSNLVGYDRLVPDLQQVLDTLVPKEVAVRTPEGRCFTMQLQLYRTLDNVIEGAVITFVDTTERIRAEEALRECENRLRQLTEQEGSIR